MIKPLSAPETTGMHYTRLTDATDSDRQGQKAASLAALLRQGHPVPDGFVVPEDAPVSIDDLQPMLAELGDGPFAVRSSSPAEDLAEASYAGRYATVLGCTSAADVEQAIGEVRASATPTRSIPGDTVDPPTRMPVIVQRQVRATAAGVAFSANPVTGDDEVVIEAVAGLADRLVEGITTGDRWVDSGTGMTAIADTGVLIAAMATRIAAITRTIADERGGQAHDIEWAAEGDELFVVQARPITALPCEPDLEIPPGRWMKDVGHYPGPVSPLGASVLVPTLEPLMTAICEDWGIPLGTIRQRCFGGEVYTQEVDLDGKHRTGAPPPWWVMAAMTKLMPSLRKRLRRADQAVPRLATYPQRWESTWRDECIDRIAAAQAVDLAAATDEELMAEFDRLVDDLLPTHLRIHFDLMVPNTVGTYELVRCCEELLEWDMPKTMGLLAGLSTASVAPVREMDAVAGALPAELATAPLDEILASAHGAGLQAWIDRWGVRVLSLDIGDPSIGERRDLIESLLRGAGHDPSSELADKRNRLRDEALVALESPGRERFLEALEYAEHVYPMREDNELYTAGLPLGVIRRAAIEIGTRLTTRGVLASADDVAYLERDELGDALDETLGPDVVRRRIRQRRNERAWVAAHPGPLVHGPPPVDPPAVRGLPANSMRILAPMFWSIEHELTPALPQSDRDDRLTGVAGSPGRYTGPVRIIRSVSELDRLQPGEVLVCPIADTNWGPFFATAGALVLDGGGILSHPAIIAREHAIPAVVATGSATTTLTDGQIVTVDGTNGQVELDLS